MKLLLMPKDPTWWGWLATAVLLAAGLAGLDAAFTIATLMSAVQAGYFLLKYRSWSAFPVQIRVAYTLLLVVSALPFLRWLYLLPTVGTFAFILFGYCLMARILSLMPWNRTKPLTLVLLRRTFFTPPVIGNKWHGLPARGLAGGVCSLEARVASTPLSLGNIESD